MKTGAVQEASGGSGVNVNAAMMVDTDKITSLVGRDFIADTGSVNHLIATHASGRKPASYTSGYPILINPANNNTGDSDLTVDSLSAQQILNGLTGAPLVGGELVVGRLAQMWQFSGKFYLINPANAGRAEVAVRQTVMQGGVDNLGLANFVSIGSGLSLNLAATSVPVILAFAAGIDGGGDADYVARLIADASAYWASLPASSNLWVGVDRNSSTGVLTSFNSQSPPVYGPSYPIADGGGKSLLHFDGNLTDQNPLVTWAATGSASANGASRFGSNSLSLNGSSQFITSSGLRWLGNKPWIVSCWFKLASLSQQQAIVFGLANFTMGVRWNNTGTQLNYYLSSTGGSWDLDNGTVGTKTSWSTSTGGPNNDGWHHLQFMWDGATYRAFVDGTQDFNHVSSTSIFGPGQVRIGIDPGGTTFFSGLIDEFKIWQPGSCLVPSSLVQGAITSSNGFGTIAFAGLAIDDEHWFDLSTYLMKRWNESTGLFEIKQRVFLGECVTGASTVSSVVTYGLNGKYDSGFIPGLPGVATKTSKSHQLGFEPSKADLQIKCLIAEDAWLVGDIARQQMSLTGGGSVPYLYLTANVNRTSVWIVTGNTGSFFLGFGTGGNGNTLTSANWAYRLTAERGW